MFIFIHYSSQHIEISYIHITPGETNRNIEISAIVFSAFFFSSNLPISMEINEIKASLDHSLTLGMISRGSSLCPNLFMSNSSGVGSIWKRLESMVADVYP